MKLSKKKLRKDPRNCMHTHKAHARGDAASGKSKFAWKKILANPMSK